MSATGNIDTWVWFVLAIPAGFLILLVVMLVRQRKLDRKNAEIQRALDLEIARGFGALRANIDALKRAGAQAYDAGLGTSPGMWQMLSELVAGEKLPESLNRAIYALCEGRAKVVLK